LTGLSGALFWIVIVAVLHLSKATRNQAEAQLAEAQKAINALKQLLANPAQ
jgi:Na+/alanine symporter